MVRIKRTLCRWLGPVVTVGRRNFIYPPPSHQKCTHFAQLRFMKRYNQSICRELNEKLCEISKLKAEKLEQEARILELTRRLQKSTRHSLYRNRIDEIHGQTEKMKDNVTNLQASLLYLQESLQKLDVDSSVGRLSESTPGNQRRKLDDIDKENCRRESFANKKCGHLKTNIHDPTVPIPYMTPIMEFSNEQQSDHSQSYSITASTPKLDVSRPRRTPQRTMNTHDLSIFDYEPVVRESPGSDTPSSDSQIVMPSFLGHESFMEQIGGNSSSSPVIRQKSTKKKETSVNSVRSENSAFNDTNASSLDTSVNRSTRPARKAKANIKYTEPPSARKVRQGDPFWCRN